MARGLIERNVADEYNRKWIASTLYGGGADTVNIEDPNTIVPILFHQTVSAVSSFFLAMLIYPEVFAKAQEEVDRVIGRDKLPCLQNRFELPYIEAIEKETLRWNSVVPMGEHVLLWL